MTAVAAATDVEHCATLIRPTESLAKNDILVLASVLAHREHIPAGQACHHRETLVRLRVVDDSSVTATNSDPNRCLGWGLCFTAQELFPYRADDDNANGARLEVSDLPTKKEKRTKKERNGERPVESAVAVGIRLKNARIPTAT